MARASCSAATGSLRGEMRCSKAWPSSPIRQIWTRQSQSLLMLQNVNDTEVKSCCSVQGKHSCHQYQSCCAKATAPLRMQGSDCTNLFIDGLKLEVSEVTKQKNFEVLSTSHTSAWIRRTISHLHASAWYIKTTAPAKAGAEAQRVHCVVLLACLRRPHCR